MSHIPWTQISTDAECIISASVRFSSVLWFLASALFWFTVTADINLVYRVRTHNDTLQIKSCFAVF